MQILSPAATPNSTPTPASGTTSTTSSTGSSSSALTSATDPLTQESTFLQLLVAQIKNQDPLNPTDSIQFVGQLVQYSQLEQLLGINQNVQKLVTNTTPNSGTPAPASGNGTQPTN